MRALWRCFFADAHMSCAVVVSFLFLLLSILARRALNLVGDTIMDYMRGRYFRRTYSRLEHVYIQYYELPAVLRVAGRASAQVTVLLLLSIVLAWIGRLVTGNPHLAPSWWSSFAWMATVVGAGRYCMDRVSTHTYTQDMI